MKENKSVAPVAATPKAETQKKKFAFPKIAIKKATVIKTAIVLVIILALVPVLDWLIQTSIVSKYAAFYKNSDITRTSYVKEMEQQYGEQVINTMLAKAAINQAAKEQKITVTDAEVNAAVDADKKRAGITSDEDFQNALAQSGMTEADYRAQVRITVTLDKLIGSSVAEPTEKELQDYYNQNKELYSGSKFADVKAQIAQEIKADDLSNKRQTWIQNALAKYNASNIFVSQSSKQYKFMRSIDLVKRLFSADPTK